MNLTRPRGLPRVKQSTASQRTPPTTISLTIVGNSYDNFRRKADFEYYPIYRPFKHRMIETKNYHILRTSHWAILIQSVGPPADVILVKQQAVPEGKSHLKLKQQCLFKTTYNT